jgi:ABC-type glycerol-3-phosphate transport system substrate-binding protein
MQDPLLWPKSLAVVMAKSTDVDMFYATRAMLEIPHMSAAGWIIDVDYLWTQPVQALFPAKQLRALKGIDGKIYASPYCLWGQYLFYRKSWLEKAGVKVPETWQELITATKKVGQWAEQNLGPGNAGMVYPAGDPDPLHQIWAMTSYAQNKTITKDGKVVVDLQSWQVVTDLWLKGGMSKESMEYLWSAAPEVFAKGKAGFIITGGVYMNMYADPKFGTGIQGDWGVTLVPKFEGFDAKGVNLAGNDAWIINPFISPQKKAAAVLLQDYLRSYQAQFNELYVEGNESSMISVYDHPAIKSEVSFPELRQATVAQQAGEAFPPGMMDVLALYKEYLHRVILGQLSAGEAREKLQKEIDAIQ